MPTVIKIKEWSKKKDPQKGKKLQILANRMFMAGDIGQKYYKIRRSAEYHLGFWDWQSKGPRFGRTNIRQGASGTSDYYPEKCVSLNCSCLPAGGPSCVDNDYGCP